MMFPSIKMEKRAMPRIVTTLSNRSRATNIIQTLLGFSKVLAYQLLPIRLGEGGVHAQ